MSYKFLPALVIIDSETFSVADAKATSRAIKGDELACRLGVGGLNVFILTLMEELNLFAPLVSVEFFARFWRDRVLLRHLVCP